MFEETESGKFAEDTFPKPVPWSPAAVRLLQGIIYHDDAGDTWDRVLENKTPLSDYFARIGVRLVVDEENGMAYLRQIEPESLPSDYPAIPTLFRRSRMGFEQSILCVILRDELRQFDESITHDERLVIEQADLLKMWIEIRAGGATTGTPSKDKTLSKGKTPINDRPLRNDEVRLNRELTAHLKGLQELKIVKPFSDSPPSWEIRPILKARLSLADWERLTQDLRNEIERRKLSATTETANKQS